MATTREKLRRRTFRGGSDAPLVEKEVEISEIAEDDEKEDEKEEEDDPMVLKGSRPTNTRTEETDGDWGVEDDDNWGSKSTKSGRPVERQEDRIRRVMTRSNLEVAVAFFIHLAGLGFYVYVHVMDGANMKRTGGKGVPGLDRMGGRWKYLTYINLWVQFGYFFLAFLRDVMPDSYARQLLTKFNDAVFTTTVFTLAIFVAIGFWGIYAVDREMIYPSSLEQYNPSVLNHFWHTTIVPVVLIEMLLVFHRYPATWNCLAIIFTFSTAYIIWVVALVSVDNFWVYPFLKVLPPPVTSLFFAVCFFVVVGLYYIGRAISFWRWRERYMLIEELRL